MSGSSPPGDLCHRNPSNTTLRFPWEPHTHPGRGQGPACPCCCGPHTHPHPQVLEHQWSCLVPRQQQVEANHLKQQSPPTDPACTVGGSGESRWLLPPPPVGRAHSSPAEEDEDKSHQPQQHPSPLVGGGVRGCVVGGRCVCVCVLYLHGGDVCVADVSVHTLDLEQVLLCHLNQLSSLWLLCELGGALVLLLGGRVLILVSVLLKQTDPNSQTGPGPTRTTTVGQSSRYQRVGSVPSH